MSGSSFPFPLLPILQSNGLFAIPDHLALPSVREAALAGSLCRLLPEEERLATGWEHL